jgi:hypothetical protein
MLLPMRRLLASLALLSGCAGVVGDAEPYDPRAREDPWGLVRDAGSAADAASGPPITPAGGDAGVVCTQAPHNPLAAGLRMREIAAYQTIKIPLVSAGTWVDDRVAPVVQRKTTLLRVFVDLMPGYTPHTVVGVLTLDNAGASSVLVDPRVLQGSSLDAKLTSTFNFEIPPELVGPSTELSLSLEEPSCQDGTGSPADARFPEAGTHALSATAIERLELVIVPVRLDGRIPSTNEAELSTVRTDLVAYYPVPDVKLSVHPVIDAEHPLDAADQSSWSALLAQIERTRAADNPAPNVYYFGVVQPSGTLGSYCLVNCVLGLAPLNSKALPEKQIAVGASFGDGQVSTTIIHELGHAHGRGHAPCVDNGTISDTDDQYPDRTGATGTWGWDSRHNILERPDASDIMGYCSPRWMSAYTYAGIAARSLQVNRGDSSPGMPVAQTLLANVASGP